MKAVVWLRRDLRLRDNVALARAAAAADGVCAAFVVDPGLLASPRIGAPIVSAFFAALNALRSELREAGSDLAILTGDPVREIPAFARSIGAGAVFFNVDYEPAAIARDERVTRELREHGVEAHNSLDHVVFGAEESAKPDGSPYKVFTPFKRAWLNLWYAGPRSPVESLRAASRKWLPASALGETDGVPSADRFGFEPFNVPGMSEKHAARALDRFAADGGMRRYAHDRDFPALDATSHLSPHLRAGTIGIRTCFARAFECGGDVWTNELIWREFYQTVLRRYPSVVDSAFVANGDRIPWRKPGAEFDAWCEGRTGYPIVDAAMRQLNETGWMHNRLRMIAASFLTKHLLIDWREGERYFEQHLLDADLAQNNGGWQWSASTGTDAAPYFRIFNPVLQGQKFDPDGAFVRRYIPELRTVPDKAVHAPWKAGGVSGYPAPIVDHAAARARALTAYAAVLGR
ncbi:MAG TPA: deoxyribodipyrimidine photo-lyase [Candidatus Baltobacteraceae bacterium]|nr:deoxyribodipyrimidine photo-lyase [Candidatus Baltobacteraceae bacterium]